MLDQVATIVGANSNDITVGLPQLDSSIDEAERRLRVRFSASYREFLRRWGWMRLGRTAYFGLGTTAENVLTETERARRNFGVTSNFVLIADHGGDELACLDLSALGSDAECPMVMWNCTHGGPGRTLANSFESFLQREIEAFLS